MENRHGLVVNTRVTAATGTAERETAVALVQARPGRYRVTVGGDKGYDTQECIQALRAVCGPRRTSRSIPPAGPVRLTAAPRGIRAMR